MEDTLVKRRRGGSKKPWETGSAIQHGSPGATQSVQLNLRIDEAKSALAAFEAAMSAVQLPKSQGFTVHRPSVYKDGRLQTEVVMLHRKAQFDELGYPCKLPNSPCTSSCGHLPENSLC
jgi:hypothetical protein